MGDRIVLIVEKKNPLVTGMFVDDGRIKFRAGHHN